MRLFLQAQWTSVPAISGRIIMFNNILNSFKHTCMLIYTTLIINLTKRWQIQLKLNRSAVDTFDIEIKNIAFIRT